MRRLSENSADAGDGLQVRARPDRSDDLGNIHLSAVGLATVTDLERPGFHRHLEAMADDLKDRVHAAARRRGTALTTPGLGPSFGLLFTDREPRDYRDVARSDLTKRHALDLRLLAGGRYLIPRCLISLSAAHTPQDIAEAGELMDRSLAGF